MTTSLLPLHGSVLSHANAEWITSSGSTSSLPSPGNQYDLQLLVIGLSEVSVRTDCG